MRSNPCDLPNRMPVLMSTSSDKFVMPEVYSGLNNQFQLWFRSVGLALLTGRRLVLRPWHTHNRSDPLPFEVILNPNWVGRLVKTISFEEWKALTGGNIDGSVNLGPGKRYFDKIGVSVVRNVSLQQKEELDTCQTLLCRSCIEFSDFAYPSFYWFLRQALRFSDQARKAAREYESLHLRRPYLAVHIRRTDFVGYCQMQAKIPPERRHAIRSLITHIFPHRPWPHNQSQECYPSMDHIISAMQKVVTLYSLSSTIFVASDDPSVSEELAKVFPFIITYDSTPDDELLTIIAMQICIDSDYWIGCSYSTTSATIAETRVLEGNVQHTWFW